MIIQQDPEYLALAHAPQIWYGEGTCPWRQVPWLDTAALWNANWTVDLPPKPPDPNVLGPILARRYQKGLSQDLKDILRAWNTKHTARGVADSTRQAEFFGRTRAARRCAAARFDRRQPCWRTGRWKSLT
jgi:hypothetical protein